MADDLHGFGRALIDLADNIEAALTRVAGGPQHEWQLRDPDGRFADMTGPVATVLPDLNPKGFGRFRVTPDAEWARLEAVRERFFPRSPVARNADSISVGEVVRLRRSWAKVMDRRGYAPTVLELHGLGDDIKPRVEPEETVKAWVREDAAERAWREAGGSAAMLPRSADDVVTREDGDEARLTRMAGGVLDKHGHLHAPGGLGELSGRFISKDGGGGGGGGRTEAVLKGFDSRVASVKPTTEGAAKAIGAACDRLAKKHSFDSVADDLRHAARELHERFRSDLPAVQPDIHMLGELEMFVKGRLPQIWREAERAYEPQETGDGVAALVRGYGLTPPSTVHVRSAQSLLAALGGNVRGMDEDDDYLADVDDDDVRELLAAFEQITGRKAATSTRAHVRFDPDQPRWPKGNPMGGQFRPTLAGVVDSLSKWLGGDRKSDPFKRYSDATLMKVAKERNVTFGPGVFPTREVLVKSLVDDLEGKELGVGRDKEGNVVEVDHDTRRSLAILATGRRVTITPDRMEALMEGIRALGVPPFNFNRLQVTGPKNKNMFRRHLRERPRETMPQLPTGHGEDDKTADGRYMKDFVAFLEERGIPFKFSRMDPRDLVASQSQLNGPKVAKIWGFMAKGWKPGGVMIVARDGEGGWAVVDGHHRWAGAAARSITKQLDVEVLAIDRDIDEVLGTDDQKGLVMDFAAFEGLADDREAPKPTEQTDLLTQIAKESGGRVQIIPVS